MELHLQRIEDITGSVTEILKTFPQNRLWLFYGPMGSGKTTIIKEFCKQLGVTDETSSPTFSIINEYHTSENKLVYHSDLYRLKNIAEVVDTGLVDIIHSNHHLFIEWPELAESILPAENVQIKIIPGENETRTITAS
ncbi:MAG: tRNA (adenosine(37)-N6)-threonylcarbamoyltransferase complex ATPase subunit type 1 TsaE [Flavobacteriales bacterium]